MCSVGSLMAAVVVLHAGWATATVNLDGVVTTMKVVGSGSFGQVAQATLIPETEKELREALEKAGLKGVGTDGLGVDMFRAEGSVVVKFGKVTTDTVKDGVDDEAVMSEVQKQTQGCRRIADMHGGSQAQGVARCFAWGCEVLEHYRGGVKAGEYDTTRHSREDEADEDQAGEDRAGEDEDEAGTSQVMKLGFDSTSMPKVGIQCVMLMEYAGVSLDSKLEEIDRHSEQRVGRLDKDAQALLETAADIAAGLRALAKAGLMHEDVKDKNIAVDVDREGRTVAKLVDFDGVQPAERALLDDGQFTPQYMAPTGGATGKAAMGFRRDLFSAGLVFLSMLCGSSWPLSHKIPVYDALPMDTCELRAYMRSPFCKLRKPWSMDWPSESDCRPHSTGGRAAAASSGEGDAVPHHRLTIQQRLSVAATTCLRTRLAGVDGEQEKDMPKRYSSAAPTAAEVARILGHAAHDQQPASLRGGATDAETQPPRGVDDQLEPDSFRRESQRPTIAAALEKAEAEAAVASKGKQVAADDALSIDSNAASSVARSHDRKHQHAEAMTPAGSHRRDAAESDARDRERVHAQGGHGEP